MQIDAFISAAPKISQRRWPGRTKIVEETGVDWDIRDMESSHSPILSRPEQLAAIVVGVAEDFGEKSN